MPVQNEIKNLHAVIERRRKGVKLFCLYISVCSFQSLHPSPLQSEVLSHAHTNQNVEIMPPSP